MWQGRSARIRRHACTPRRVHADTVRRLTVKAAIPGQWCGIARCDSSDFPREISPMQSIGKMPATFWGVASSGFSQSTHRGVLRHVACCIRVLVVTSQSETRGGEGAPPSKSGDYSDVKVVTPYGEITWRDLSRISDEEMKRLMIEIVDKLYTFLCGQKEPEFLGCFSTAGRSLRCQVG